jgi:FtsP/CotA-like multicopper oxidase with cupredoxin domain
VSLHPHGVLYTKANEGAAYPDGTSGADLADDAISPGQTYTYRWDVPERAGPGPGDPSSVVWLYHSHVNSMRETAAGLVGVIVVTRRGSARPDGSPNDVDREFVTLFNIFDETVSHFSVVNTKLFAPGTAAAALGDKDENKSAMPMMPGMSMFSGTTDANRFFAINGYIFGNVPQLRMKVGERVRWYLVALGGESDLHTPHWHGNVVTMAGRRTDVVELLPASMRVADMVPDNPGIWLFHCHVEDHMMAGMSALYEVVR